MRSLFPIRLAFRAVAATLCAGICVAGTYGVSAAQTASTGTQPPASGAQTAGWPTYGGDPGGMRYTAATQITRGNVGQLAPAWTFHTGAIAKGRKGAANSSFEATPVLFGASLYLTSPYDEVFSLDPATGRQNWMFDPQLKRNLDAGLLTSRGVATWRGISGGLPGPCAARIFVATMDARLIALDAANGQRCAGFGSGGEVDLTHGIDISSGDVYYNTSPPTVVRNVVIVGSGIIDNQRVNTESGVVRGYDAETGAQVWGWDPIPWAAGQTLRTGAANAWSVLSADVEHRLVFVPTGSPSPDFFGGLRPGDDRDANSVVALDARSGQRVWGFQTSHHDLWDYDVAAEPLLFTWRGPDGKASIPAIAITTKQGLLFVLNRLTGAPLFPVDERAVPQTDVAGETTSPTQPFEQVDSLAPVTLDAAAMLGGSAEDNAACRKMLAGLRYEGMYTPPSLRGSLEYPGNLGGVNWGGAAFDPASGVLYANTNRYGFVVTLSPRKGRSGTVLAYAESHQQYIVAAVTAALVLLLLLAQVRQRGQERKGGAGAGYAALVVLLAGGAMLFLVRTNAKKGYKAMEVARKAEHFGTEFGPQLGTPYTMLRAPFTSPKSHVPCTPMPWGTVSAINLNTGKKVFEAPLGTRADVRRADVHGQGSLPTGTVNLGGDMVTASGLVFTAATEEPLLRAFDAATGAELWRGALPVPAQSTPMSYTWNGRQYVVIAAGGHGLFGTPVGDSLIAFALP